MFSHKQDSELNDIIEGFQMFASDEGGLINPNDLKEIMETMNMAEKNPYIYNIILDLCSNPEIQEKGGIEASDFISLLDQGINDTSTTEGIHNIFSVFSNPSTNTVPLQIFSQIAGEDNSVEGGEDIKNLISKPEMNGKELNFDEFHDIVKTETPKQNPNERPLYIKKSSSREGYSNNLKNKFNNKKNNDDSINNNNDFNNINNNMGSKNSSERNSSRYSYQNKRSPNIEENNNNNYKYTKGLPKKSFPLNANNNDNNNLDYNNQKDEGAIKRKVYRHNRGSNQDKDNENDYNYDEEIIENIKNIEENNSGEKSDRAERRYHRRYRETKPSYKK